jgi:hypothetical protein
MIVKKLAPNGGHPAALGLLISFQQKKALIGYSSFV